jgi:acetyl esterase
VGADRLGEARAFNAEFERDLATRPPVYAVPPEQTRRARRDGVGILGAPEFLPQAREVTVPARGGEIRARVLAPESEPAGVYLHIHGGGWVLGACDEQDVRLWELVEATGLCAVSVNYRLAPEHPYPAGPDDCEDAALWLLERGLQELGAPDPIAIGGESAGAHLSVTTLLRLRDRHGLAGRIHAANLVFGVYDLSMTPSQRLWGDRELGLSTPAMRWFGDCFVPELDLEERRRPDVSPLYAELENLPPALFTVAELDLLVDDSLFLAARWQAAGNEAEVRMWPEALHGFTGFPIALARAAREAQYEFLRAQ